MQAAGSGPTASGSTAKAVRHLGPRQVKASAQRVNVVAAPERKLRDPRQENVAGDFYVDSTCIDCDTCRWMAPDFYSRINEQSAIHRQPQSPEERKRALHALLACPTFSIHARNKQEGELGAAFDDLPVPLPSTDNVFHLVMTSENSYGAASYLIRRPQGNIIVDSPRFDRKLLKRIQAMGGVKYMVFSHRDDVCDHARWAEALGCQRILHHLECNKSQGTDKVEVKLEGQGPWKLPDGSDDVELLFTPGHTQGHVVTLFKPDRVLCSGDHWGYSGREKRGTLFRRVNWYNFDKQIESLAALKPYDFVHVAPGHGRPMSFQDRAAKDAYLDLTVQAEVEEGSRAGAAVDLFAHAALADPFQATLVKT